MMKRDGSWAHGDWMMTSTGKKFWPEDPRPEELDIVDIAHGLANQIRFGGQIKERYTVAQHSVHVLELVMLQEAKDKLHVVDWQALKLAALLHDGAEAFLGDMPTPVKRALPDYKRLEGLCMAAIESRWVGYVAPQERHIIKAADLDMLAVEARRFYGKVATADWNLSVPSDDATGIMEAEDVWGFDKARVLFLSQFHKLTQK